MKKAFILGLLLVCLVVPQSVVWAQEDAMTVSSTPTPQPGPKDPLSSGQKADGPLAQTVSPTPITSIDYTLPYPGILPDNPLYMIKTIRDRIVTFFISDPLKKSAFFLLQSDKRIEASWYLLKKDPRNDDLALSTLSKSTNYLEMAIQQVRVAKDAGEDTNALTKKLLDATVKHTLVIQEMILLPNIGQKANFVQEEKRVIDLGKVVSGISPK